MVRIHPDPPTKRASRRERLRSGGAIAQLGERLLCKQEVIGSIPIGSTSFSKPEEPAIRRAHARLIGASSFGSIVSAAL